MDTLSIVQWQVVDTHLEDFEEKVKNDDEKIIFHNFNYARPDLEFFTFYWLP